VFGGTSSIFPAACCAVDCSLSFNASRAIAQYHVDYQYFIAFRVLWSRVANRTSLTHVPLGLALQAGLRFGVKGVKSKAFSGKVFSRHMLQNNNEFYMNMLHHNNYKTLTPTRASKVLSEHVVPLKA
jgi:hypothetical protein